MITLRKNKKYLMLVSTKSPSWESEAASIENALDGEGIKIVKVIPVNFQDQSVEFIPISDKSKKEEEREE